MPNWCDNSVTLRHEDPAQVERARAAFKRGEFCREFVPLPQGQEDDWYDFCVSNWGTKWDVGGDDGRDDRVDAHELQLNFDSAWSPPMGVYEALVAQGFEVLAYYHESGMAFVGRWDNGDDEYYEYSGEKSDTVRDVIGEDLDDYFCISEQMAEYEAEECDEVTAWYEDGVEETGLTSHRNSKDVEEKE